MTRNGITAQFALFLLALIVLSPSVHAAECPSEDHSDASGIVEACTTRLHETGLPEDKKPAILVTRGWAFYDLGRMDAAALDFDKAIALSSEPAKIRVARGYVALAQRDFRTAAKNAALAQSEKPDSAAPYTLIGRIKRQMLDFNGAAEAYRKAISIDSTGPYHYDFFLVLVDWGHDREALEEADAISRLPDSALDSPNTVNWWGAHTTLRIAIGIERGKLLNLMGRFDDAEKAYADAIRDTPTAQGFAQRADFHRSRNAAAPIIQSDVDKALALDPGFWLGHAVQAELDNDQKNTDGALAEYAKAAQLNPQLGWIQWQRALVLRNVGRVDEATSEALAALQTDDGLFNRKSNEFSKLGYLRAVAPGSDPTTAIHDAVQACMLDERCP